VRWRARAASSASVVRRGLESSCYERLAMIRNLILEDFVRERRARRCIGNVERMAEVG
jgi:hypothetical protein